MQNLATKLDPSSAVTLAGHVIRIDQTLDASKSRAFVVRIDHAEYRCQKAASCLLEPSVGDRVLLSACGDGSSYVLAVLEREDAERATLTIEGNLFLSLPSGSVSMVARDGITLASTTEVAIVAPRLDVKAVEGSVAIDRLAVVGTRLLAEIVNVKAVAETIDTLAERISQKAKRMYRFVEELDQLKAKHVDYSAERGLHLHGQNSLVTADELVKVDGEHIHMG